MKARQIVLLLALSVLVLPSLGGQETPESRLEKARVIERHEQDPVRAAALLKALATEPGISATVRSEALADYGRILSRLGKTAEAKQALTDAAAGEGPGAVRARALLDDNRVGYDLNRRIDAALMRQDGGDLQEIRWFGDRAIPALAGHLKSTPFEPSLLKSAVSALLAIGTEEAAAVLAEASQLPGAERRLLIARSFNNKIGEWPPHLFATALLYLGDSAPEVRAAAVEAVAGIQSPVPEAILLALIRDESDVVRYATWNALGSAFNLNVLDDATYREVHLEGLNDDDFRIRSVAWPRSLMYLPPSRHGVMLKVMLEALASSNSVENLARNHFFVFSNVLDELPAGHVVNTVDRVLARPESADRDLRLAVLRQLVARGHYGVTGMSFEDALGLFQRGWLTEKELNEFVEQVGSSRIPELVALISRFPNPFPALKTLARLAIDVKPYNLPDETVPAIAALLDSDQKLNTQALQSALIVLQNAGSKEGTLALVRGAKRSYATATMHASFTKGEHALLTLPLLTAGGSSEGDQHARAALLVSLLENHSDQVIPHLSAAYALGMQKRDRSRPRGAVISNGRPTGKEPESADVRLDAWVSNSSGIDDGRLLRVANAALATGHPDAIEDVLTLATRGSFPGETQPVAPPRALVTLAAEALKSDPELLTQWLPRFAKRWSLSDESVKGLILNALGSDDASLRMTALSVLKFSSLASDQDLYRSAVTAILEDARDEEAAAIADLLKESPQGFDGIEATAAAHPSIAVRMKLLDSLAKHDPDAASPYVLQALKDESQEVRAVAMRTAGLLLLTDATPELLGALRSPHPLSRAAATSALAAIEAYVTTQQRWERLRAAAGLSATSAAASLLDSARNGKTQEIRVMAIDSLGTLGVPETLPALLALSEHEDPEISRAATRALKRINATKK